MVEIVMIIMIHENIEKKKKSKKRFRIVANVCKVQEVYTDLQEYTLQVSNASST